MAPPLVDRSTGDVINASDHNDVKDYVEDAQYRVNTSALSIGGSQVIDANWNGSFIGSVTTSRLNSSGSIVGVNGSFTSTLIASNLSGNNTGDQTLVGLGGLPQGALPYGSLVNALPHGQLPTGSLPNTISISGSVVAAYGSFTGSLVSGTITSSGSFYGYGGTLSGLTSSPAGSSTNVQFNSGGVLSGDTEFVYDASGSKLTVTGSIISTYGSFSGPLGASNLSGTNTGDQTNISGSAVQSLPHGVLPVGSIPSLVSSYIPQGQLINGSLPTNISVSGSITTTGSILAAYGSITGNFVAGSYYGYGGTLSGISASSGGVGSSALGVAGSIATWSNGGSIQPVLASVDSSGNLLAIGSITTSGSVVSGYAVAPNLLPQGVLPTGSIPSLSGTYIPHGTIAYGSLTASLPQGVLPYGSLTTALPQGLLPIGSIPVSSIDHGTITGLTDDDHTQYLLTSGSRDTHNVYLRSVNAGSPVLKLVGSLSQTANLFTLQNSLGSTIGQFDGTANGSFWGSLLASNLSGTNTGDQTNISGSALLSLPQGVLPIGSVPSLTSLYIPQGQLINGSMPNTINISGSIVAVYGSFSGSLIAGSFFGYGGSLTGLPTGVTDHGALTGLLDDDHSQYLLVDGTRNGSNLLVVGSLVANGSVISAYGSYTGSIVAAYGIIPNLLPQGVLPTGSIPSLSATYIPHGQLPTGSLPNTITISNDVQANDGSFTGSLIAGSIISVYGSISNLLPQGVLPYGSLVNSLPHGVLPVGSIPSLVASYIPQGQLVNGSMPNTISISGSIIATYGSVSGSMIAGSYFGYGGALTGIVATSSPAGSNTAVQFNDAGTGSGDTNLTWNKAGSSLQIIGSVVGTHGSFTGSIITNTITTRDLNITSSPSANLVATGTKTTLTAGETLAVGDFCYINILGSAVRAIANNGSTVPGLFMALSAPTVNTSGTFLIDGQMRNDAWSWSLGSLIYAGNVLGSLTQTVPSGVGSQVQVVGIPITATTIKFSPSPDVLSLATAIDYLPQGVLPTGSIPSLSGTYIPHGVIAYGSLTAALPQGALPVGSIPSLSASYIPQGQLINGSLPTNISVSGSITTTGSIIGVTGSFAGSLYGYGGTLSGVTASPAGSSTNIQFNSGGVLSGDAELVYDVTGSKLTVSGSIFSNYGSFNGSVITSYTTAPNLLPQGVLPTGSIPSLSGTYIPHGVIAYGSLTTALPQGVLPYGSIVNALPHGQLPTGSLPDTIIISNDLQANDGSFSGSLLLTGSLRGTYGSFTGSLLAAYGVIPNLLPQGVLPVGSIPSLSASYIPHGVIAYGSLTAALPQGVLPYGSLTNSLPHGVLPTGSIPNLTASYIPQGQLINGSMPNTISISGSIVAVYGSIAGSMIAGSYYGYGGTLSGITAGAAGGDTQVQFNDGGTSLGGDAGLTYNKTSDTLTITGSLLAPYGSYSGSVVAGTILATGSVYGYGGTLSGISAVGGGGVGSGAVGISGSIAVWTNAGSIIPGTQEASLSNGSLALSGGLDINGGRILFDTATADSTAVFTNSANDSVFRLQTTGTTKASYIETYATNDIYNGVRLWLNSRNIGHFGLFGNPSTRATAGSDIGIMSGSSDTNLDYAITFDPGQNTTHWGSTLVRKLIQESVGSDVQAYHQLLVLNNNSTTGSVASIGLGVSASTSVGASIAHKRLGAAGYGDLIFSNRNAAGTMREVLRIADTGSISALANKFTTTGSIEGATVTSTGSLYGWGDTLTWRDEKVVVVETPSSSESITMFYADRPYTIDSIYGVNTGTSPSCTFNIRYGSTRDTATPGSVFASNQALTSTTGSTYSSFSNTAIGTGSWIWFVTSAVSGTVNSTAIQVRYRS